MFWTVVGAMSQWNPRRSRGASQRRGARCLRRHRLSGTPAEAGVRDGKTVTGYILLLVSVEPPPKQGCESSPPGPPRGHVRSQWNPRRSRGASCRTRNQRLGSRVSVEPPPKQGCEASQRKTGPPLIVSVEPPPKQGCEDEVMAEGAGFSGLSGTPAEAGVRGDDYVWFRFMWTESQWNPRRSRGARSTFLQIRRTTPRLSGTPAEAGVRGGEIRRGRKFAPVSVEPPPKQGCEEEAFN